MLSPRIGSREYHRWHSCLFLSGACRRTDSGIAVGYYAGWRSHKTHSATGLDPDSGAVGMRGNSGEGNTAWCNSFPRVLKVNKEFATKSRKIYCRGRARWINLRHGGEAASKGGDPPAVTVASPPYHYSGLFLQQPLVGGVELAVLDVRAEADKASKALSLRGQRLLIV